MTGNLLLKSGDKLTRSQGDRIPLRLAAVKGDTVHIAVKVDDGVISHLGRPVVYIHHSGITLLQAADLSVNLLVADLLHLLCGGNAL